MAQKKVNMGRTRSTGKSPDRAKRAKKLRVVVDAERLEKHTYTKCRNLRLFPKKDRGGLPNRMVNEACDILADIMDANDFNLADEAERVWRLRSQRSALRKCRLLIHHIELTHDMTPLDDDAFAYWAKLANDVKNQVAAWVLSDRSRVEKMGRR